MCVYYMCLTPSSFFFSTSLFLLCFYCNPPIFYTVDVDYDDDDDDDDEQEVSS